MNDGVLVLNRATDVHQRLLDAGIDNAIGGALALAYHIDDPRATQDIDINVSLPATHAVHALEVLPEDVPWDGQTLDRIREDDQVRIMWPVAGQVPIPLDLFFAVDRFHDTVQERAISVPMLQSMVKVLSATDLAVFKALYDRSKDWPDIIAMRDAHDSALDIEDAAQWVTAIVGPDDSRVERLRQLAHG